MTLRLSPEDEQKAAVLLESLVRNRALIDGNKRIGWLATVVFYGLNNIELEAPDDDAYDLVIAIATGAPRTRRPPHTWRSGTNCPRGI